VLLINHGSASFIVNSGDRIAQMIIAQHQNANWKPTENLDETERGSGGYGHTGIQ
jgi:dUTP pyrophosphatase